MAAITPVAAISTAAARQVFVFVLSSIDQLPIAWRFGFGFQPLLGPPVVPFYPFLGEGSPTKVDYIKKKVPLF